MNLSENYSIKGHYLLVNDFENKYDIYREHCAQKVKDFIISRKNEFVFDSILLIASYLLGLLVPQITSNKPNYYKSIQSNEKPLKLEGLVSENLQFDINVWCKIGIIIFILLLYYYYRKKYYNSNYKLKKYFSNLYLYLALIQSFLLSMNLIKLDLKGDISISLTKTPLYGVILLIIIYILRVCFLIPQKKQDKKEEIENLYESRLDNAEKLKELIKNEEVKEIFIDGRWGIGKTFFIRNVLKQLKQKNRLEIIKIDALLENNKEKIIKRFFDELDVILEKRKIMGSEIKHMKNYFNMFNEVSPIKLNLFKQTNKSLNKIKEEYKNTFDIKDFEVILVVDDLDRIIERENILGVLSFLYEIKEFSNLKIVVLGSFDYLKETIGLELDIAIKYLDKFFVNKIKLNHPELKEIIELIPNGELIVPDRHRELLNSRINLLRGYLKILINRCSYYEKEIFQRGIQTESTLEEKKVIANISEKKEAFKNLIYQLESITYNTRTMRKILSRAKDLKKNYREYLDKEDFEDIAFFLALAEEVLGDLSHITLFRIVEKIVPGQLADYLLKFEEDFLFFFLHLNGCSEKRFWLIYLLKSFPTLEKIENKKEDLLREIEMQDYSINDCIKRIGFLKSLNGEEDFYELYNVFINKINEIDESHYSKIDIHSLISFDKIYYKKNGESLGKYFKKNIFALKNGSEEVLWNLYKNEIEDELKLKLEFELIFDKNRNETFNLDKVLNYLIKVVIKKGIYREGYLDYKLYLEDIKNTKHETLKTFINHALELMGIFSEDKIVVQEKSITYDDHENNFINTIDILTQRYESRLTSLINGEIDEVKLKEFEKAISAYQLICDNRIKIKINLSSELLISAYRILHSRNYYNYKNYFDKYDKIILNEDYLKIDSIVLLDHELQDNMKYQSKEFENGGKLDLEDLKASNSESQKLIKEYYLYDSIVASYILNVLNE